MGEKISAFVYRPDAQKFPRAASGASINIHGGPEGQSRPDFLGRSNYYLDELGCVLVLPNVRGSAGYGKTFLTLDNGDEARGLRARHRRAARLDRAAAGPRRRRAWR